MMTPQLVSELERINDREVALSPRDHSAIPDMIRPRQTQAFRCYRVPQKYRLKVYGSEGHKNGANHIIFLCMFFSTSGHMV